MADLGAVLRKTIDGLPNASPSLRAKVYDKARAAIQRQIESANPPMGEEIAQARRAALEDAIGRTEAFYLEREIEAAGTSAAVEPPQPEPEPEHRAPAPAAVQPRAAERLSDPALEPPMRPAAPRLPAATFTPGSGPASRRVEPPPAFPAQAEEPEEMARPQPIPAPFVPTTRADEPVRGARPVGEGAGQLPDGDLPAMLSRPRDTDRDAAGGESVAPLFPAARPRAKANRRPLIAAAALLALLGGAGALAWIYRGEIDSTIADLNGGAPATGTSATQTAAAPDGGNATPAAPPAAESTRLFTQRLLPDGTEVDEGPAAAAANAFGEGSDVAAASPAATPETADPDAATTLASEIGQDPTVVGSPTPAAGGPAGQPAAGAPPATPPAGAAVPVGQRAVFYEERSDTEPGTQQAGDVVWSVVNEVPGDGQPAEPAIRAVASVPEEKLTLTLTIRRNADPTLPASHVIELMFDTPADFDGGSVANVQRLALKPTEQARGEPLIGVAGKISDGFFIIALNNIDQAVQNNLSLLGSEQWIDIPLAYQSGRRALISIEKGIPGDRVFKEAMDAWTAKSSNVSSAG
ncbi:hypothetical protein [Antarcticirhabdus aurantiaca]|uniref:Uncharacterized protein n=1 Tax=Antarcticirhabdus aurantiaca TaxID=2606717 RepID=A0ACD4NJT2_9HYPH|nr:hypothetical protein [Antarcticirhabdus aurantiaca]WAJ27058.1 hypothetical protein OXU80_19665 [Jeongeuplla avenae]